MKLNYMWVMNCIMNCKKKYWCCWKLLNSPTDFTKISKK